MIWQILVPTIPHRHTKLVELLDALADQMVEGVGVVVYRDNLEQPYGPKCQALAEASTADYISFLSDDDMVATDFVSSIVEALEKRPDHVGFKVLYTEDGVRQQQVEHSLDHPDWGNTAALIYRDITHFDPIRRDLALAAPFTGHAVTDREWADALRETGQVRTEVFIDREILHYRHTNSDYILTQRSPLAVEDVPSLPAYPFVKYIGGGVDASHVEESVS